MSWILYLLDIFLPASNSESTGSLCQFSPYTEGRLRMEYWMGWEESILPHSRDDVLFRAVNPVLLHMLGT